MTRTGPARTNVERSLLEVEAFVRDFADDNPHVDVTLLRFANVLGDDIDTPFATALRRPVVPEIFGFDPRVQFVHEDDVVGALMYATTNDVPGVYNVAGDGNLPWSEVCAIVGKRRVSPAVLLHDPRRRAAAAPAHLGPAARSAAAAALRPLRSTTRATSARGSATGTRPRERSKRSRKGCGSRPRSATSTRRTATSATSRTSSATRPPSCDPTRPLRSAERRHRHEPREGRAPRRASRS